MNSTSALRLVGRGRELAELTQTLHDVLDSRPGHPALVTVSGDDGIGKSRLIREAHARSSRIGVRFVHARCEPHGPHRPWHPLRRLLLTLAEIPLGGAPERRLGILNAFAEARGFTQRSQDALRHLLSLPTVDPAWTHLPMAERRHFLHRALRELLLTLGDQSPTVLVLEDIHWIDAETLRWIDWTLDEGLRGERVRARILFLTSHRLEFQHIWPAQTARRDIHLRPLGRMETKAFLRQVIDPSQALPAGLAQRLSESTQGVPLFLEEATHLLWDRGALVPSRSGTLLLGEEARMAAMPTSGREIIEDRIHRLSRETRHFLQCAAVIGAEIPCRSLEQLAETNGQSDSQMQTLVDAHFLTRSETSTEPALTFRHAIIQEVVLSTLLEGQRRHLHGRIGEILEDLHRDHLDDVSDLLSHHFTCSDQPERAVEHLRCAAEQALHLSAHESAEAHLESLRRILLNHGHRLGDTVEMQAWVALRTGQMERLRGELAPACETLRRASEELAQHAGREILRIPILRALGETERQHGHLSEAIATHREALALCRRRRSSASTRPDWEREEMLCQVALGVALRAQGSLEEAMRLLQGAERVAARLGDDETLASALNNRGICLLNLGQPREALAPIERAAALRRRMGDHRNLVATLNNLGIVLERLLELDRALTVYVEALRLAHEIGHHRAVLANHINAGQLLQWLDNQPEAMRHFRMVIEECRRMPDSVAHALALINLAWSHIHQGDPEPVARLIEQAEALGSESNDHSVKVHALLLRARWALSTGDCERALKASDLALRAIESAGGGDEQASALRLRAQAEIALGRTGEAALSLRQASRVARASDERREGVQILLAHADAATRSGRARERRRHLRRASRVLERHPIPLLQRMLSEVADQ
ncbi:tetratricopeptide repeat protein [Candidatus Sumerlaeota bacterium]|nr:tetratricopeptide repeat protein [Candidatus Sumerlaeota bacterium]